MSHTHKNLRFENLFEKNKNANLSTRKYNKYYYRDICLKHVHVKQKTVSFKILYFSVFAHYKNYTIMLLQYY